MCWTANSEEELTPSKSVLNWQTLLILQSLLFQEEVNVWDYLAPMQISRSMEKVAIAKKEKEEINPVQWMFMLLKQVKDALL